MTSGPRLNYALIRGRAADMAIPAATFTAVVGLRLSDLEDDCDGRAISLSLLGRLAALLDLTLDQLVTVDATPPALAAEPADAPLLLAVLLSHGSRPVEELLDVLDWTADRLHAATAAGETILAGTPLRLVATDQRLTCVLRPSSLPEAVRAAFADSERTRAPLAAYQAGRALALVHEHLLAPVGEPRQPAPAGVLAELAECRLATDVVPADDPEQATARPHQDFLFALGLADAPQPG